MTRVNRNINNIPLTPLPGGKIGSAQINFALSRRPTMLNGNAPCHLAMGSCFGKEPTNNTQSRVNTQNSSFQTARTTSSGGRDFFHGTTSEAANNIMQKGMKQREKGRGATYYAAMEDSDRNARRRHFVSTSPNHAKSYAHTAAKSSRQESRVKGGGPATVKMHLSAQQRKNLKKDPMDNNSNAFMTNKDIPKSSMRGVRKHNDDKYDGY